MTFVDFHLFFPPFAFPSIQKFNKFPDWPPYSISSSKWLASIYANTSMTNHLTTCQSNCMNAITIQFKCQPAQKWFQHFQHLHINNHVLIKIPMTLIASAHRFPFICFPCLGNRRFYFHKTILTELWISSKILGKFGKFRILQNSWWIARTVIICQFRVFRFIF